MQDTSRDESYSPTASMRLTKAFIADATKQSRKVRQLDFIAACLQAKARDENGGFFGISFEQGFRLLFNNLFEQGFRLLFRRLGE